MLKRKSIIFIFSALFSLTAFSQETARYTSNYAIYQHGLKLFRQHQYSAAQRIFERVHDKTTKHDLKAKTAYYTAIAAIHLGQTDAEERLEDFVTSYPASPQRNSAYHNVATYYFQNGNYDKAGAWYEKVNTAELPSSERNEYYFNNGYIAFKTGHPERAKRYFSRVQQDEEFGSQTRYYLGYLAYKKDNYQKANRLFDKVDDADKARKKVAYFQSNMSFKSGEFETAIAEAKEQLPRSNRKEQSELNKIIGESYFNLEQYEKAIPYLEKYHGENGRWSNTDYYQLGYAYYKKGAYKEAVSQFNQIINGHNGVAQNAYYHLAESYIKLGQKQRALNAFKNASEMNFNQEIKEDAALNYAKLSYDIGNSYKSVPEVLTAFLTNYPNSPAHEEIKSLLVNSYLTSSNYKKALELLESSRDFADKVVYQKVAFYRGVELYTAHQYKEAKRVFEKSLSQHVNQNYTARATYWKAECNYMLQNYSDALIGYKQFKGMSAAQHTPEITAIDYNIGYAYFNQGDYKAAATHFKAYAQATQRLPEQKNDAYLRLGDSYFASSDYWSAMEAYNKAIAQENVDSDYAYYQKAISYGFVNKNTRKIEDLVAFLDRYPSSIYRDDALYQLGNTYVAESQPNKAIKAYAEIIQALPNSAYVSRAILKQGLIYYNTGKNQQALTKFKKVATTYPNSEESDQAVRSARNIYVDLGKVDAYASWVKTLGYVNVTSSDLDNATYEAAESKFIENDYDKATRGFEKYLNKFPDGAHVLSANFYLAHILYKQGKHDAAKPHYEVVINKPQSHFTEKALVRLSRIYLEKENYQQAIPTLQRLENAANLQKNITFAQSNLMKAYYEQKNYAKTVAYAEKVLHNDKAGNRAQSDAHIYIARSAMKTGDEAKAQKAYAQVAKMAHGKLAAEAQYYEAYFKRKAGDYEGSNKAIQVLAKDYSGYREYSAKSLLLMGENFYDLKDAFQATYILKNIVENFDDYPAVVAKAKAELQRIKAEQAKTNSSVDLKNTANSESPKTNTK